MQMQNLVNKKELLNYTQIADDLHSSRVVISRLLKQLETKGIITTHRNKIVMKQF